MTMRCTDGGLRRTAAENAEIDLRLAVMCCLVRPGECVPRDIIAEVTGMSHGGPWTIEQRAIMKLRKRLRYTADRQIGEELAS